MPFHSFLSRHLRRHRAGGATKRRTRLPGSQNAKTRPCRVETLEPRLLLSFSDWIADASNPFPGEASVLPRWIDYNNDGWSDAVTNGFLWRNDLATTGEFTRVTTQDDNVYPADFDNDGWTDLIAISGRGSSVEVLRNVDGTGVFQAIASTTIGDTIQSQGASVGDFNDDGYVDMYIGGYEIWPHTSFPDKLVLNAPVTPTATNPHGRGFVHAWTQSDLSRARGITSADWNEDGRLDVYVSNYRLQPNLLWVNNGNGSNFPFDNGASTYHADGDSGHSIGSAWGDMDSDGLIDLLAGNFAHAGQPEPHILLNQGPDQNYAFHDRHREGETGIPYVESYASPSFGDFDNDGMLDLLYTALVSSYGDNNVLMRNVGTQGNPRFADVTGAMGLPTSGWGDYQVTWADIDNDGDLDLGAAGRLWRNDTVNNNNWLKVQLRGNGTTVDGSAIGAQVRVTAGNLIVTRQVESGTGQGQVNDLTLHFGLGSVSGSVEMEVSWPDGKVETRHAQVNQSLIINYNGPPPVSNIDIGEVGQITNLTHESQTISLDRVYDNPVVFAQSPSYVGSDPVSVRVTDVQADQFNIFLTETSNQNGVHNANETVTYVVLEAGQYELVDGTKLEAGIVDTSATVGNRVGNTWERVTFETDFDSAPVVLSQIQTQSVGGAPFLNTRQGGVSTDFFVALEQEELIDTPHVTESVGYLAIDAATGSWNGFQYEATTTGPVVTANFYDLTYTNAFNNIPSLLTSITTYRGEDSSNLRLANPSATGVQVKVKEDTTFDEEVAHNSAESVAYLAIGGQGILTALQPEQKIGEVGRIASLTHDSQVISLNRQYTNPVVFAQSASFVGNDPVVVRVTDVRSDQFEIYLAEPSNENGQHNAGAEVTYVVLEAGMHRLTDGTRFEVGTVDTSATVGKIVDNQWESISFSHSFSWEPIVLTQIQTTGVDGENYLQTRHRLTTANGFDVALEQEEAIDSQHGTETIGYFAIDGGTGLWGGMAYEAGNTAVNVTGLWTTHTFASTFESNPSFLSSMSSYKFTDNGHLRYLNLGPESVQLKVDEDRTLDAELGHSAERVSYLAIESEGALTAALSQFEVGEVGRIASLTHDVQTIILDNQYTNPVVFAQSASLVGGDPVVVRVKNVQSNQFEIYLAEPSNLNGVHNAGAEVTYLVLEAGSHQLANGTRFEAGAFDTSATVGVLLNNSWRTINFNSNFASAPIVFSQIQTKSADGAEYLQTRQLAPTSSSIQLALEQQEDDNTRHTVETVGYLAIDAGSGLWNGALFEVAQTDLAVRDTWYTQTYANRYDTPPFLLTSLATYNGFDNSHVRYSNSTAGGVDVKVEEDTSWDVEVIHNTAEIVNYLAIASPGTLTALVPTTPRPQVTSFVRNDGAETYGELDTLEFTFNEQVNVAADDLYLYNDSAGGTQVDLSAVTFNYDAASSTGTWDLSGVTGITPGSYSAVLDGTSITDMTSLLLDGDGDGTGGDDYSHNVVVAIAGDANLDLKIDVADFNTLVLNFDPSGSSSGNVWSKGNFDGDGDIDITDFTTLVLNFFPSGYAPTPTAPAAAALQVSPTTASSSLASSAANQDSEQQMVAAAVAGQPLAESVERAFADIGTQQGAAQVLDEVIPSRRARQLRNWPSVLGFSS